MAVQNSRAGLLRLGVVAASLGAGIIHLAVAPAHFAEYWLFGAFFFSAGLFQVTTAALLQFIPKPSLVAMVVVSNGLISVVWLVSRTTGLPVGPHSFTPEDVGSADAAATVLELLIVAGGVWLLTGIGKGGERIHHVESPVRDRMR